MITTDKKECLGEEELSQVSNGGVCSSFGDYIYILERSKRLEAKFGNKYAALGNLFGF